MLEYKFSIGDFEFSLFNLIKVFLIYFSARLIDWSSWRVIGRYLKRKSIDIGRLYAFRQFLSYIIYTLALLMAIEAVGIKLSVLWGGAAALLVGVGLGLQQTFNDLVSGIILLIEGSVEVDDIININGLIGKVKSIKIRTTQVETRDGVSILIPNSRLVGENAINWSHTPGPLRFQVDIGVAYSSDPVKVTALLLEAASKHDSVMKLPAPKVQFKNFGNSALIFELHFYSKEYMKIEFVKSDIRYQIFRIFTENNIEIPFPQHDIWLRNEVTFPNIKKDIPG